jgi:hypothetical protein
MTARAKPKNLFFYPPFQARKKAPDQGLEPTSSQGKGRLFNFFA